MKIVERIFLIAVLFLYIPQTINAQYEVGKNYTGPAIGLSFLGSSVQLGINYERSLDLNLIGINGPGKLGIGGIFRYWSYSSGYFKGNWNYSNFLLGAQGNYHFDLADKRFDPWLGLVLAINIGSVSWDGPAKAAWYVEPSAGGFWIGFHAGLRYWLSPTLAVNTRIGFGTLSYGALDIGVDFKF